MLPPGFKKDSRTWLHKNPKPRTEDVDKTAVLKRFLDSEQTHEDCSPYFMVEHVGKQFKKDSRTWLHKSSLKKQQQQRSRRKCPAPVAGDGYREPEFARSNTDVRLGLQDKVRLKGCSGHSSDCDLLSNDHCLRNVLRKKRGDTALMHSVPTRRPYRTVSEERLGDEISSIMAHNCLNAYSNSGDRMTELADETTHAATNEENANHQRLCYDSNLAHHAFLRSYPSAIASDKWRDTARVKSDTSFSENSHGSMDTLAQVYDDDYNSNDRGETNKGMDALGRSVADKLRLYPSDSRSSVASTCIESAQLRMMSLCASPPASSCSGNSISEEDLKSSDIDL